MQYTYRPILRWKGGEQLALENLSAQGRRNVFPLIHLLERQFKGKRETKSRAAVNAVDNFTEQVSNTWGMHPFALDASALPSYDDGTHPILHIAAACASAGIEVVPALNLADLGTGYYHNCMQVAQNHPVGALLQLNLDEFTDTANWASAWGLSAEQTDLVVDVQNDVSQVLSMSRAAAMTFQHLHLGDRWRSVTIAGTSMPNDFSNQYAADTHWIPRQMPYLWHSIASSGLSYRLDYGDYTTVAVRLPPEDQFLRPRITARYTTTDSFMICRGFQTSGPRGVDQNAQYFGHASTIAASPYRAPLNIWADAMIDSIASGDSSPGNPAKWVGYSVNRHIERMRTDLP